MHRLAFLASHNGSSAKAILQACQAGHLQATPHLLISNNPDSKAVTWAREAGLETAIINKTRLADPDGAMADLFREHRIDWAVCSGYMRLIGPKAIALMQGRFLNIHPALLPDYGGQGMYGAHVHQAVFDNKDEKTGITIHRISNEYDRGDIIAQYHIPVTATDTPESIEAKVKKAEPAFYIETLKTIL